jgi:hypothetical protein
MASLKRRVPALLAMLLYLPFAKPEYNANENVVLADCGIGNDPAHPEWADSFYAFYYPGEVWSNAEETQINELTSSGQVTWDGSYPWRESGVTFTMDNGDVMTATIHPNVNDPNRAGSLTHTYDDHPLTCWSYHKDLPRCRAAYICNHKDDAHPANRDRVKIALSTTKDFAKLSGNVNPADVYGKVSYSDDGKCDESWKDTPGTTPALAATLKGLADNVDIVKHEHTVERVWDPCKSGRDTCIGGWVTVESDWTWIPQTMSIDISNAGGADVGAMEYETDCSAGPQCDVCNQAKFGAGFAAFVAGLVAPALGVVVGAVSQGVSGTCLARGC